MKTSDRIGRRRFHYDTGRGRTSTLNDLRKRLWGTQEGGLLIWAISRERRRPGDMLTRADVCHLHDSRDEAEQCAAEYGGAPELVKLERRSERVYRVVWSLSDAAGGTLRRSTTEEG